jgi:hypothetical protein
MLTGPKEKEEEEGKHGCVTLLSDFVPGIAVLSVKD